MDYISQTNTPLNIPSEDELDKLFQGLKNQISLRHMIDRMKLKENAPITLNTNIFDLAFSPDSCNLTDSVNIAYCSRFYNGLLRHTGNIGSSRQPNPQLTIRDLITDIKVTHKKKKTLNDNTLGEVMLSELIKLFIAYGFIESGVLNTKKNQQDLLGEEM